MRITFNGQTPGDFASNLIWRYMENHPVRAFYADSFPPCLLIVGSIAGLFVWSGETVVIDRSNLLQIIGSESKVDEIRPEKG